MRGQTVGAVDGRAIAWRAALGRALVVLTALLACVLASPATAETRIALVIGNSQYAKFGLLPNPQLDAEAVARTLQDVGFEVTLLNNQSLDGMNKALNGFALRSQSADVTLIYYAGHGIEVAGRNYLIPTDAVLSSDADVRYQAVPLDAVLGAVERSKGLGIIILDACRDNPFIAAMTRGVNGRSVGQGLGKVDPPNGVLVAFSAAEGAVAQDGKDGAHSPFAQAFMHRVQEPGLEINLLLGKVHDDVLDATGQVQSPRSVNAVGGRPFYFRPPVQTAAAAAPPAFTALPSGAAALTVDNRYVESQYWASVAQSTDPEDYRAYLEQYPQGQFAGLARNRVRALSPGAPDSRPTELAAAPAQTGSAETARSTIPASPASPPVEPPPQPAQLAALTPPAPRAAVPTTTGPLARPTMIEFDVPTLPSAFCTQVDMNSYLTDLHTPLDRAAKTNNQTAIAHFESLKALFNRYVAEKPGSPEFMAVSAEVDAYAQEARRRYDQAAQVNALDAEIRKRPISGGAGCGREPWPNPVKTAAAP